MILLLLFQTKLQSIQSFKSRTNFGLFEMKKRERGNLLVGYFALGGDFASLVGIGLNRWWNDYYAELTT